MKHQKDAGHLETFAHEQADAVPFLDARFKGTRLDSQAENLSQIAFCEAKCAVNGTFRVAYARNVLKAISGKEFPRFFFCAHVDKHQAGACSRDFFALAGKVGNGLPAEHAPEMAQENHHGGPSVRHFEKAHLLGGLRPQRDLLNLR